MKRFKWMELLISIVGAELVGALSQLFTGNTRPFFDALIQPPLTPPATAFPVVWVILYAMMGTAAYLVYQSSTKKKDALLLYAAQLLVNFIWSIVFFRFHALWLSVAVIVLLILLLVLTIRAFYVVRKPAAYLMLPYLLWVLFATYLNIAIAILN